MFASARARTRVPPSMRGGGNVRLRRMRSMKRREQDREYHKYQQTAFGAHASPGQPRRTLKRGGQKMPLRNQPAIGYAIKIALRPIPGRVHSHGKPQAPRPPQGKAKEQSNQSRRQ